MIKNKEELKYQLCYVDPDCHTAYFTTQDVAKQTGSLWDEAPYENKAGEPDEDLAGLQYKESRWQIIKVMFEGSFEHPCSRYLYSPYSVYDINRGEISWLLNTEHSVSIKAGCYLSKFIELVNKAGGVVYVPTYLEQIEKGVFI